MRRLKIKFFNRLFYAVIYSLNSRANNASEKFKAAYCQYWETGIAYGIALVFQGKDVIFMRINAINCLIREDNIV